MFERGDFSIFLEDLYSDILTQDVLTAELPLLLNRQQALGKIMCENEIKDLLLCLLDELPDLLDLLPVDGVPGDVAQVRKLHVKRAEF